MKKILVICIMAMFGLSAFSQSATKVDNLKQQQQVLDLTAKLNKLEIEYAKEQANLAELQSKATPVNASVNAMTTEFNTSDAASTVKNAKKVVKKLDETKAINKKLAKSQKNLTKMQAKIAKLKAKLETLNKKIEIVEQ